MTSAVQIDTAPKRKRKGKKSSEGWRPTPGPQERFLECGCFEALYGGAAGGGKSEALLVGALRHIANPNYSAILFRRTYPELKRSLIKRSQTLYRAAGGSYNRQDHVWSFPSGATIEFGSLEHEDDVMKYQSAEYQYIGFDELTTFLESQYVFMISRLRSAHGIPTRLRAATNPGGPGHDWVLKRFAPWLYPPGEMQDRYAGPYAEPEQRLYFHRDERKEREAWCEKDFTDASGRVIARGRVFFPALVTDNPYYAGSEYELNLDALPPLQRARLKFGNWMARAAAGVFFKRDWFEVVDAIPDGVEIEVRVRYWDRAASKKKRADFTAGLRLCKGNDGYWYVENVKHFRGGPFEVKSTIKATGELDLDLGSWLYLEQDPGQAGVFEKDHYLEELAELGVRFLPPQGDKITRAMVPSAQAEARKIRLLKGEWNEAFVAELEDFPDGHDDQVDALSGAMRAALKLLRSARTAGTVTVIRGRGDDDEEAEEN